MITESHKGLFALTGVEVGMQTLSIARLNRRGKKENAVKHTWQRSADLTSLLPSSKRPNLLYAKEGGESPLKSRGAKLRMSHSGQSKLSGVKLQVFADHDRCSVPVVNLIQWML